jgi:hypothetical protein
MKLWDVGVIDGGKAPWGYDCSYAFIIRAETEEEARRFAAQQKGDEGEAVWLNPALTSCSELTADGEPGVILRDFLCG